MSLRPGDEFKTVEQYSGLSCFFCNMCKEGKDPDPCARCSRVTYCSKECRKSDSKVHQPICFAITTVLEEAPARPPPINLTPPRLPSKIRSLLSYLYSHQIDPLRKASGNRMGRISTGLVFNARRCAFCLNDQSDAVQQRLRRCPECVYSFCVRAEYGKAAEEHRKLGLCSTLQQIADDERYLQEYELYNPVVRVKAWLPPRLVRTLSPLPLDWPSYFDTLQLPASAPPEELRTMIQHSLSIPLTIVASLERFGLLSKFSDPTNRRTLTVQLIGAEKYFEVDTPVYEELNHLLPGVSAVRIVMVGDKLAVRYSGARQEKNCRECKKDGRTRSSSFHPFNYYEWLHYGDFHPDPPDLILAFNSGICELPRSWYETILYFLSTKSPVVLTSLNKSEAKADAKVIRRFGRDSISDGLEWVWEGEKNPWASGRKHFDVLSPGLIWSEDMYWFGFRGV